MRYMLKAYTLAEERGYFRYPEVRALEEKVPDWFRRMGTDDGVSEFEKRHGVSLPISLREFYSAIPLACFCEACWDTEVLLRELMACMDGVAPPPIIEVASERYVVVGFHGHSGLVAAIGVASDDPPVVWGFMDDPSSFDQTSDSFSEWIFCSVDGYEKYLDYCQSVCETCDANPSERIRLANAQWLRRMPGMSDRLGKR